MHPDLMKLPLFGWAEEREAEPCAETFFDDEGSFQDRPRRDKPLSFHWRGDPDAILAAVAARCDLRIPGPLGQRRALASILIDMAMTARAGGTISYSRDRTTYIDQHHYQGRHYTYANVIAAIDLLAAAGLFAKHYRAPQNRSPGVRSWFRPVAWLAEIDIRGVRYDPGETIRMKDSDGRLIRLPNSEQWYRERRHVQAVNEALEALNIDLLAKGWTRNGPVLTKPSGKGIVHINLERRLLHRVWNHRSRQLGGRFFGGTWQGVPGADRVWLTIDGAETAEADFRQLHARFLYLAADVPLSGDAYTIDRWPRDIVKTAFQILLNAPSTPSMFGALAHIDGIEGDHHRARQLFRDLRAKHAPVAHLFGTGLGLRFQNHDAAMARFILSEMVLKRGIPTLMVHDSAVVPRKDIGHLQDVMEESLNRAGVVALSSSISVRYRQNVLHMETKGGTPGRSLPRSERQLTRSERQLTLRRAQALGTSGIIDTKGLRLSDLFGVDLLGDPDPITDDPIIIGPVIAQALKESGLRQREFGRLIGIRQPHVSNIGKARDHLKREKIRRAFEVLRDLIDEDEDA